jgi:hypothetical protein
MRFESPTVFAYHIRVLGYRICQYGMKRATSGGASGYAGPARLAPSTGPVPAGGAGLPASATKGAILLPVEASAAWPSPATPADAHAIATVQSWSAAYRDLLARRRPRRPVRPRPQTALVGRSHRPAAAQPHRRRGDRRRHRRLRRDPDRRSYPPIARTPLGDLYALYLHPDVWRRDIGTQLDGSISSGALRAGCEGKPPTSADRSDFAGRPRERQMISAIRTAVGWL